MKAVEILTMTRKNNFVAKAGALLTLTHHLFNGRMSYGNKFIAKMIIKMKNVLSLQMIIIKQESSMN